jgi:hypothetical protein
MSLDAMMVISVGIDLPVMDLLRADASLIRVRLRCALAGMDVDEFEYLEFVVFELCSVLLLVAEKEDDHFADDVDFPCDLFSVWFGDRFLVAWRHFSDDGVEDGLEDEPVEFVVLKALLMKAVKFLSCFTSRGSSWHRRQDEPLEQVPFVWNCKQNGTSRCRGVSSISFDVMKTSRKDFPDGMSHWSLVL